MQINFRFFRFKSLGNSYVNNFITWFRVKFCPPNILYKKKKPKEKEKKELKDKLNAKIISNPPPSRLFHLYLLVIELNNFKKFRGNKHSWSNMFHYFIIILSLIHISIHFIELYFNSLKKHKQKSN